MLGLLSSFNFVQGFFGGSAPAVGVDLGTETIRLAQVQLGPEDPELLAAASRDVPGGAAEEPVAYADFCATALRELWREGQFAGRKAVLGLPSSMMHLLHLRLPKMDPAAMQTALTFEAAGKLPFDPVSGILRHHPVGDIYTNDGPRQEVICTAVRRDHVELLLNAAEKARLDVVGMVASPMALRDGFGRMYRRANDGDTGFCFVDIGRSATRVTILRSGHLYFARSIPIGSEHFNDAVAKAVGIQPAEAKMLRAQLAEQQVQMEAQRAEAAARAATERENEQGHDPENGFAMLGAAMQASQARAEAYVMSAPRAGAGRGGLHSAAPAPAGPGVMAGSSLVTEMSVAQAIEPVMHQLADELQRCRRYHEGTFPNVQVDRLVFVGGEAHSRALCQAIARRLGIAAQLGDPIACLCPAGGGQRVQPDLVMAGIDRRRPQPAWAVVSGLAIGAAAA